jgi:ABC-type multidrug transport system fused ATPase/permease subunit
MLKKVRESDLVRVLSLLGPYKWSYALWMLLATGTIATCFNIVLAFVMKDVLDAAVRGEDVLLTRALYIAGGTLLGGTPLVLFAGYMMNRCVLKTMTALRVRVFSRIVDLPMSQFERGHSGDLVSRCTNDLGAIQGIYTPQIYSLAMAAIMGLVAMVSIFVMDWRIGLAALFVGLLMTLSRTLFLGPLRRASDAIQEHLGKLTERLTDLLQGLPVTKMFHLEPAIHRLYTSENNHVVDATIRHTGISALSSASSDLVGNLGRFGLAVLGLYFLMGGTVEVGTVWAITHLSGNASFLFGSVGNFVTGIQRALAGASRVFELLDWPIEQAGAVQPTETAVPSLEWEGSMVTIVDLAFSYEGEDEEVSGDDVEVLRGINMSAGRGQVAALVGPSGGGKSTIVKLLLGFYPLQDGQVVIDGKPIETYSLARLRSMMAYVPQDAYLFDGTIEENIRYGKPDASREEVVAASKAANAHDFIVEQPDGYDTPVGERGAKLSGGQRQRIAIARALLKDAPILLLDEATSALDSESEQLVQDALGVLMKGRTTVAIAHRLSTVESADAIYVIDDGRVIEEGRHDELVGQGGLYIRLHELQFGREKAEAVA